MAEALRYLSESDVAGLCAEIDVLDTVEDALRRVDDGSAGMAPETALRWTAVDGTEARSLVLPAHYDGNYGCKIINACIGNPARGLPRAHGLIVLHDPVTAAPVCVMEGATVSALRTAAVSAVAVRALRRSPAARTLALLGCGRQSAAHLDQLTRICPDLTRVIVYDIDPDRAQRFSGTHADRITVDVAADPRTATSQADLIVATTTTTTPYVELQWLRPGATFVNVSLDDAAASLLLGCDHLIVDNWDLIRADEHRLLGSLARAGAVTGPGETSGRSGGGTEAGVDPPRRVDAHLAAIVTGKYTREIRASDRVVVNPFGMGVHDIAVAAQVYRDAAARGIGIMLPR